MSGDLNAASDCLARDGSEIRLLCGTDRGSLAHCTLHPGSCSSPVRHPTVHEIWYVVEGPRRALAVAPGQPRELGAALAGYQCGHPNRSGVPVPLDRCRFAPDGPADDATMARSPRSCTSRNRPLAVNCMHLLMRRARGTTRHWIPGPTARARPILAVYGLADRAPCRAVPVRLHGNLHNFGSGARIGGATTDTKM